jgi:hypothetical protein
MAKKSGEPSKFTGATHYPVFTSPPPPKDWRSNVCPSCGTDLTYRAAPPPLGSFSLTGADVCPDCGMPKKSL